MVEWDGNKSEFYPCSNMRKVEIFWNWTKIVVTGIIGFLVYIIWRKR